ncbi:hypothetical protein F4778DRAFT_745371 [Xylariomycetidae sp. FL2044]|nr:hypothetical protein F4778DRAFT_745371 [Xylariomycetidae sp. FL2044]
MRSPSYTIVSVEQTPGGAQDDGPEKPAASRSPQSQPTAWTAWLQQGWLAEIASLLLGIVLIIALAAVLRAYDGKVAPRFGAVFNSSLTLNTIVAILSTGSKAALLYPVAECISQLKWIWFSKDYRKLSHMSTFDSASRGIVGGFELAWETRLKSIASVGSLLMLFSLAVDPMSQQLVSLVSREVPTPVNATIPVATTFILGQGMIIDNTVSGGYGDSGISSGIKGVIQTGLYSANETVPDLTPSCMSGNCTFPPYWSLAVCSSFADVSSHLEQVIVPTDGNAGFDEYYYQLTNGSYITSGWGLFNSSSAVLPGAKQPKDRTGSKPFNFTESIAFRDVTHPLADLFVIHDNGTEGEIDYHNGTIEAGHRVYGAVEVLLEWCAQEFTTEVLNGVPKTVRRDAKRNFTGEFRPVLNEPGTWNEIYSVDGYAHSGIVRFLNRTLAGSVQQSTDGLFYASSDAAQALFEPYNTAQVHSTETVFDLSNGIVGTNQTGLEHIVNNIATSITNYVRSQSRSVATGTTLSQEIVVEIRWPWIAAHVVFVGLSLLLLVCAMVQQHLNGLRGAAWKSSSLAVLHALEPSLKQSSMGGITTEAEMSASAKEQLVRLRATDQDGWHLRGAER